MRKFGLVLLCSFFSILLKAQDQPLEIPPYYYFYQMNEEEVIEMRYYGLDPHRIIHDRLPIDSVRINSMQPATFLKENRYFGYFVMLTYTPTGPHVQQLENPFAEVRLFKFDDNLRVMLLDSTGILDNYTLKTKSDSFYYNPECACINIDSKKFPKGTYVIQRGKDYVVFEDKELRLKSNNNNQNRLRVPRRKWWKFWQRPRGPRSLGYSQKGFVVLNQAEYRHNDSLKSKAYLMNKKGRPYTGDVKVIITNRGGRHYYLKQTAKYLGSGTYAFDWAVPDSMFIDQHYLIQFVSTKNSKITNSTSFKVTHYSFVNYELTTSLDKSYLYPEDTTYLILKAQDKNKIPLAGTKVDLKLYLQSPGLIHVPKLILTQAELNCYFDTSFYLGAEEETKFPIFREMLPPMEHNLSISVVMTTPNNDRQTFSHRLQRNDEFITYTSNRQNDDLTLIYNRNEKSIKSDTVKVYLTGHYFSGTTTVFTTLPYTIKNVNQYSRVLVLDKNNRSVYSENIANGVPSVHGNKTNDSLIFEVNNPSKNQIHWELFYDEKKVGHGNSLQSSMALKGDKPVQVYLYYVKGRDLILNVYHVYPKTKELTIQHTIPEVSYPGQEVFAELKILDFYGKPVKNANITAFSVNTQMPVLPNPNINYFGVDKELPYEFSNYLLPDGSKNLMRYDANDSLVFEKFKLDRFINYRLYYTHTGVYQEQVDSRSRQSQLIVHCLDRHNFNYPFEVWVDNELVYLAVRNLYQSPAIPIKEGRHKVQVRTYNYMIQLDSIMVSKGKKTLLGLNTELLINNPSIQYEKLEGKYEEQEIEQVEKYILWFSNPQGNTSSTFIKQDEQIVVFSPSRGTYDSRARTYFAGTAPIAEGMVEFISPDTSFNFYFNPDNLYEFKNKKLEVHSKSRNLLGSGGFIAMPFYYENHIEAIDMDSVKRLYHHLDSIKNLPKPVPHHTLQPKPIQHTGLFTNYHFRDYGSTNCRLHLQDSTYERNEYNFYWLENLDDPKYSVYYNNSPGVVSNLKPGNYKLLYGRYLKDHKVIDRIRIESNQQVYMRIDLLGRSIDQKEFQKMQYRYFKTLQDYGSSKTPLFETEAVYAESPGQNANSEVNGWVSINYQPARSAYILFMSTNGGPSYMAMANNEGFFNYYDIKPGKYYTHIISSSRHVFLAGAVTLDAAKLKSFNFYCFTEENKKAIGSTLSPNSIPLNQSQHSYNSKSGKVTLRGLVTDKVTGEPLPFVNLAIYKDGMMVKGAVSDMDGLYSFSDLSPGNYFLNASFIGMLPVQIKDINIIKDKVLNLNILMEESNQTLSEVSVQRHKERLELDEDLAKISRTDHYMVEESAASYSAASPIYRSNGSTTMESLAITSMSKKSAERVIVSTEAVLGNKLQFSEGMEAGRLKDIKQDVSINTIRNDFRNNAYWEPLLLSDKNGVAKFNFRYSDDQTYWAHYFIAIDKDHNTRLNKVYSKSYKPLSANIQVPEFAVDGDKIIFKNQVRNLTGDTLDINLSFKADNQSSQWTTSTGPYYVKELTHIFRNENDTTVFEFSLDYDGYIDGERRTVGVLSSKVPQRKVRSYILGRGENIKVNIDPNSLKSTVKVRSGLYDLISEEIESLKSYSYGCVEQTASKLIALVYEKRLKKAYGEEFTGDKDIEKMIDRLEDFQHRGGGFGWWKGSKYDVVLTVYAAKALILASEEDYKVKGHKRAVGVLINQYNTLLPYWKMETLLLASSLKMKFPIEQEIQKYSRYNLPLDQKIQFIELQLKHNKKPDLSPILDALKKDRFGLYHIAGKTHWGFNSQELTLTLQAYRVLKLAGRHADKLASMRKYVFNRLTYIQRNTFEKASIIYALCDDALEQGDALLKIKVGSKEISTKGKYDLNKGEVTIQNLGEQVSLIIQEDLIQDIDHSINNGIALTSKIGKGGQQISSVKEGEIVRLQVQARVSEHHRYVVLNVPIPAGFQIIEKPNKNGNEIAREYFKDHIVLYFESLPKGHYHYSFTLLPKFKGSFTLLPAWMEDMYMPSFFGCEAKKRVDVH